MAYYWKLRDIEPDEHRSHVADRLQALREHLRKEVLDKTERGDLRLATWNLMHFGDGGGYWRQADAMCYIAEIIDHFDLVAIQEVNENLTQLEDLLKHHLGEDWDYIVTDTTEGDKGNFERLAFLYRKDTVTFSKIAGEIVLPEGQSIAGNEDGPGFVNNPKFATHLQFARSPFVVGFQAGWFHFKLCTVHIYYGKDSGTELELRRREIDRVAKFLAERADKQRKNEKKHFKEKGWDTDQSTVNYILLGDFNIISPEHETMDALRNHGFQVPAGMEKLATNLSKEKRHYDQIAFKLSDDRFEFGTCGKVDFRDVVFRDEDAGHYIDVVKPARFEKKSNGQLRNRAEKEKYFKRYFRKHQMSDHQLLWSSFRIDFADDYLEKLGDKD